MNKALKIAILGNKSKNNINKYVWLGIFHDPNITYIPEINKTGFIRFCYRLFFNHYVLYVIPGLNRLKKLINHSFLAKFLIHDIPPEMNIIICSNTSCYKLYPYKKLEEYKIKYKSKIVLFLHDTYEKISKDETNILNIERGIGLIDKIYSFDPYDCSTYGFSYIAQCYTPIKLPLPNQIRYDIYFGGRNKGRLSVILAFLQSASANDVSCFYRIPGLSIIERNLLLEQNPLIFEDQMLPYEETLKEMQYTNCILEIVQEGQHGISWRAVEAFAYNKKLLTNNEDIINNPFYNPEYIHVFKNIDDIDFDWVKEQIPINYHYHNEYSPIEFIQKVIKDLEIHFEK